MEKEPRRNERAATANSGLRPSWLFSNVSQRMKDPFKAFNEIEWRTYETFSALAAFESFWKETERLVSGAAQIEELLNGPKWTASTEEERAEHSEERRIVRYLHDEVIMPTFRYSSVVALFATFEREIRRFADNLAKEGKAKISYKDLKGGLLDQISKYAEAFCGFSTSNLAGYSQICDLQKIRDCVVHCHGELALFRDKAYLLKLGSSARGLEIYEGASIGIAPLFIESSIGAVQDFFHALFSKVGWRVNERWLKVARAYARIGPAILDGAVPLDQAFSSRKTVCALVRAWLTLDVGRK